MKINDLSEFLFSLPLYTERLLDKEGTLIEVLVGLISGKADGHCPYCRKATTFTVFGTAGFDIKTHPRRDEIITGKYGFRDLEVRCARDGGHKLRYWFHLGERTILKVGQLPSLADIANDEAANYRSVLNKEDSAELHKAIGLAAHGVGIGSFVYLRRIFERLVQSRFDEFQAVEKWDVEAFKQLRMNEKVTYMKGHLPDFLVQNSKLYSILSKGIHELSEEICLQAFDPLKLSIKIILEEDKRKQDELELRRQAAAAIAKFEH